VFIANRVHACTAAARLDGVAIGQRRREAQSRCPELFVFKADAERDARDFEPVATVVEALAPGLEVLRPGLLACPARGPTRYFRGESKAAEAIVDAVEAMDVECRVGIADTLEVAVLASRLGTVVPLTSSPQFCAPLPIGMLAVEPAIAGEERPQLVDLLVRLGIGTLGDFAALPDTKVGTRFGTDGVLAHRLAKGLGERTVSRRHIPPDLTITQNCDPPLDRVDTAAFAARALAERFHARLADAGLACTRLTISAHTETGRELSRTWRCASPLTPAATADRLRWQLDGWLSGSARVVGRAFPSGARSAHTVESSDDERAGPGAITVLTLEPVEAVDAGRIQFGLWGSEGEGDQRAGWALARVQGLLGPDSVLVPALSGGRGPAERVTLVPWGQERTVSRDPAAPWPGAIPAPSPTVLPSTGAALCDARGNDIVVTERGVLSGRPHWFRFGGGGSDRENQVRVAGWGGPWLLDERWWDTGGGQGTQGPGMPGTPSLTRLLARVQLELVAHPPVLAGFGTAGWVVEGVYD
jgi:protein ImuB